MNSSELESERSSAEQAGSHIDHLGPSQPQLWEHLREYQGIIQRLPYLQESPTEQLRQRMAAERIIPISDRSLAEVSREHGLGPDDLVDLLRDKTVLDVGAGNSTLADELARQNIATRMISLDIDHEALGPKPGERVQGAGENLPFQDETFDRVLATYSLPIWAQSGEQVKHFYDEAMRVTKPGGSIHVAPVTYLMHRPAVHPERGLIGGLAGSEMNQSFKLVLREVELASIDWLEAAERDSKLTVVLGTDMEQAEKGHINVSSATIHKR